MEHKNNILVETLSALFFIAEKMKVELCINKADGKLYIVKERDKETASLLPLNGENAPVVIFNPENLIFRYDFLNSSENNELLTAINGATTEQQRSNNGITTESDSGQQRDNNGIITGKLRDNYENLSLENRAVIGKGKINLPRISDLYSGDIAAVLVQIEALIDKVVNATNKNETIKKIITFYESTKKAAQKANLFALKQIEKSLSGIAEKQKAMQKSLVTVQHKEKVKKNVIKCLTCALLITALFFYFKGSKTQINSSSSPTSIENFFDAAISEYEIESGKKIYPYGRDCLRRACKSCTTKEQCLLIIKKNMSYE